MKTINHNGRAGRVFNVGHVPVSTYNGVIVIWDEDYDTRVLGFIDTLSPAVRSNLLTVHEHEGTIELLWAGSVPPNFVRGGMIEIADGDWWSIIESKVA